VELQLRLPGLSISDRDFAASLIGSFKRYGHLTPGQSPWVGKLIARATQAKPETISISLGSFANVVTLFTKAKAHLKYPKIKLDCGGTPVILSVAGPSSKNPGSINVAGEGRFGNRSWYGRITPAGEWIPSQSTVANLQALLTDFGIDPAGVAKKYGVLTGNCCFCNTALTDARSRAAGFGPVCAGHYDLKEEWKAAAKNAKDEVAVIDVIEKIGAAA
jgi:hypothetical protein